MPRTSPAQARRRPTRRFRPTGLTPLGLELEPRSMATATFITNLTQPLGLIRSRTASRVPPPWVLGGPQANSSDTTNWAAADTNSSFSGPTRAAYLPPNIMTPVGADPATESGALVHRVTGPPQSAGQNSETIEVIVAHHHIDMIQATPGTPTAIGAPPNNPTEVSRANTETTYSWNTQNVSGVSQLIVSFSLNVDARADRFQLTPGLVLQSTHLNVTLGSAGNGVGLWITDPTTGTNYVSNPNFNSAGSGGSVNITFVVPPPTAYTLQYNSVYQTGVIGQFDDGNLHTQDSSFSWSLSLGLSQ